MLVDTRMQKKIVDAHKHSCSFLLEGNRLMKLAKENYQSETDEAMEFRVKVKKMKGKKLGITMNPGGLLITDLHANGLIAGWNRNHEGLGLEVREGDSIISVNGVDDSVESVREEMKVAEELDMILRRDAHAYAGRYHSDVDSGFLYKEEFIRNMEQLGVAKSLAADLFEEVDHQNVGYLDGAQFYSLVHGNFSKNELRIMFRVSRPEPEEASRDTLLAMYRCWNQSGSHSVSRAELERVANTLNPGLTQADIESLHAEIDLDRDGTISFNDWIGWLYADVGESLAKKFGDEVDDEETLVRRAAERAGKQRTAAEEARRQGRQRELEELQHKLLQAFLKKRALKPGCNTLVHGPGAPACCTKCHSFHFWFCHYCGYITHGGACVNGCDWGVFGWSCITSKCDGPDKCICQFDRNYILKHGYALDTDNTKLDIGTISNASHAALSNALLKKDQVIAINVRSIDPFDGDAGFVRLSMETLAGKEFQITAPLGVPIGTFAPDILAAASLEVCELKLLIPSGASLGEKDCLPNSDLAKILELAGLTGDEQISAAFRDWDADGNGLISKQEFIDVMRDLGNFSVDDLHRLFDAADQNHDDSLNYEEFLTWIYLNTF